MSDHDTVTCEQCDEPIVGRRVRTPICKRCLHAGPRDLDETLPECHSTVSERGHLRGAWCGSFERRRPPCESVRSCGVTCCSRSCG